MNVQILNDGNDITTKVISYEREKDICTGVGLLRLELEGGATRPGLYSTIVIYENGIKKGTFFVLDSEKNVPNNTITVGGQDASVKLQNYFIAESYQVDYASNSTYWIEKFLAEATVSFQYENVGTGTLLSNNTGLGLSSAMDQIIPLLQQNGWYMTFDADNVAHIGMLLLGQASDYQEQFTGEHILDMQVMDNDKMFRNRVVVWGNANSDEGWVKYDLNRSGLYDNEYDQMHDVRTVVIANSNIPTNTAAAQVASQALREFDSVTREIAITVAGAYDLDIGDSVRITYDDVDTIGFITTISSSASANGLVTIITIGQRCPRLFAYYTPYINTEDYVYVGMDGAGVWRKALLSTDTWENFSTGLTTGNLEIIDLAIQNQVFGCVSSAGNLFTRTLGTSWVQSMPASFLDTYGDGTSYPKSAGKFVACTIDKATDNVIGAFTLDVTNSGDPSRSWITYHNKTTGQLNTYQFRDEEDEPGYTITHLDNNASNNLVSAVANYSGEIWLWNANRMENYERLNTAGYLMSGYTAGNVIDWSQIATTNWLDTYVAGDGKYIYSASLSESALLVHSLYVWEYNTIDKDIAQYDLGQVVGDDETYGTTIGSEYVTAVGNRCIAIPTTWEGGLTFLLYSFKKQAYIKRYDTRRPIFIYGTSFAIVDGRRRVYFVYVEQGSWANLRLGYYDIEENIVRDVASVGVPTIYNGANLDSFTTLVRSSPGSNSGEYIMFILGAVYNEEELGWGYNTLPVSIFYPSTGGAAVYTSLGFADYAYALGGWLALSTISINDTTATDGYVYIAGGFDSFDEISEESFINNAIVKSNPYLGYNASTWTDSVVLGVGIPTRIQYFMYNREKVYAALTNNSVINAGTGTLIQAMSKDIDKYIFSRQLDDITNSFYVLDIDTSFITEYRTVEGEGTSFYVPSGVPNTTWEGSPLEPVPYYCNLCLVYDSFFLSVYSRFFDFPDLVFAHKQTVIQPPLSGERLTGTVDYTRYAKDEHYLMHGYGSGYYAIGRDTAMQYEIESAPGLHAVFGGISYSGIVFSGEQTGFNQGRMFITNNGIQNTYSQILLNGWDSYVNDLRIFEATITGTMPTVFVLYPQPTQDSGESTLYVVDVTTVGAGEAVITSGTLNQHGFSVASFDREITCVETTNELDVPTMFVAVSGASGVRFYQKDYYLAGEIPTTFEDNTGDLPTGNILCIRCDDTL